jgi:acetyl coenzyme A synthetase (ADP forming)-like protein
LAFSAGSEQEMGSDVALDDGSMVHIRRALEADAPLYEGFVACLSDRSLSQLFLAAIARKEAVERLAPGSSKFVLIGEREGKIVGHAAFSLVYTKETARMELLVLDSFQRRGLGTILLGKLAEAACREGVGYLGALMSPDNHRMIKVLHGLGFPTSVNIEPGVVKVTFPTSLEGETVEVFDRREAIAAVSAMRNFLKPNGVAVIGASRDRDSIGGRLFRNIIDGGFRGPVYPVNSNAAVVQSVTAYRSVLDCPGPVDLAVVAIPARAVADVARECAQKGVKGIVVISSGFAETGREDGRLLQRQLLEICRESGMRLIGPNCMGVVNTDPKVGLNAQFSPFQPKRGRTAFFSQSGALGIAVMEHANRQGLGMSSFISAGNRADVSNNDAVQYWETDESTDLILLYLESFGNPRKFARIAKQVSRKKPILAMKAGRTAAGFRATQSHTGALLAASDLTVDALFRQAGVIRVDTLGEMFDVASLLSSQPVPRGDGVAIITNAGGAGILAADACESEGLRVPELHPSVQEELRKFLSPEAGVRNPVDMIASATAEDFAGAIRAVAKDTGVAAIAVLFVPPVALAPEEVAEKVLAATAELKGGRRIPVITSFVATHTPEILAEEGGGGSLRIPSYPFPELAVRALARAVTYGRWLQRPADRQGARRFDNIRREEAIGLVARNLGRGVGWMSPEEAEKLLGCYGIPTVRTIRASTAEEAARAASALGGRVVLKGVAEGLVHKTEAGAVVLNLSGEAEVGAAAEKMSANLSARGFKGSAFLIQPMLEREVEMIVGVTCDPIFGPVIACGAGGTLVELMKDVSVRLTPITQRDASEMLRELKSFPLLDGYRGAPPCDVPALEELIQRVSLLADDLPEVSELDLNPVMVGPGGASVVDYRIRLGQGNGGNSRNDSSSSG